MDRRVSDDHAAVDLVLDALTRLERPWTVLRRPRFGLERPDAVAVHPQHGVCVIVVASVRPGAVARNGDGRLLSPAHRSYLADQPHLNAARIADVVYDGYYADPDDPVERTDAVRSLLVAPCFDDADARATFARRGDADVEVARTVWGSGFLSAVEPAVVGSPSASIPSSAAASTPAGVGRVIRGGLVAPAAEPVAAPVRINPVARPCVDDPAGARCRRVRGPGGSGKTFVLTARAAALAAAKKRVCLLSFTTTLHEWLTDLVRARCAELGADSRLVTISSFHELAEHTVLMAEAAGYQSEWPKGARWPQATLDRARQVIEQGFDFHYDALLIDEGQDFQREWCSMLQRNYLKADGEMMIAVNPDQDLYGIDPWFDDDSMSSLGFVEPWVELEGSIRTPADLVPALSILGDTHRLHDPSAERAELIGPPVRSVRRWVDAERIADLGRLIGREVVRLVREHPTLTPSDIVFLCDYHHDGLAAVREIERAGIPVHHQFSRDPAGRGIRRRRFSVSADAVKGAIVHGFKGRETGALVMGVGADVASTALAVIAIERIANVVAGESAVITIVNGNPALADVAARLGWDDDLADAVAGAVMPTPAPAVHPTALPTPARLVSASAPPPLPAVAAMPPPLEGSATVPPTAAGRSGPVTSPPPPPVMAPAGASGTPPPPPPPSGP